MGNGRGTYVSEEKQKTEGLPLNNQSQQDQRTGSSLVCLTSVTQKSSTTKKGVTLFCPVVIPFLGETQNHVKHNGKYLRSSFINQERL